MLDGLSIKQCRIVGSTNLKGVRGHSFAQLLDDMTAVLDIKLLLKGQLLLGDPIDGHMSLEEKTINDRPHLMLAVPGNNEGSGILRGRERSGGCGRHCGYILRLREVCGN